MSCPKIIELFPVVGKLLAALFLCSITCLQVANAADRIALVIGNSAYESIQDLHNPSNDAADVAEKIKALDFQLFENKVHMNLNERQLIETYNRFVVAAYKKHVALLYYAGHGMQFDGEPHLLPVDVPDATIEVIQNQAISLNQIIGKLDDQADLSVAIFDACRNIPDFENQIAEMTRGGNQRGWRGLSRPDVRTASTIIAYSGASGEVVADGLGRNSPYTEILISHLDKQYLQNKTLDIPGVLNQVAWEFKQRNPGLQSPELLSSGIPPGVYYFVPLQSQQAQSLSISQTTSAPEAPLKSQTSVPPEVVSNSEVLPVLNENSQPIARAESEELAGPTINTKPQLLPPPIVQAESQPLVLPKEQLSEQVEEKSSFCSRNRVLCIGGAVLAAGAVATAASRGSKGGDSNNSREVSITVPIY